MRAITCFVALFAGITAYAQVPKLGEAKFVAAKANAVRWNRAGDFLSFGFQAKGGHWDSLGLFDCAKGSGATILTPGSTSNIENYEWLGGKPIVLADVSDTVAGQKRRSLVALDGRTMKSRTIWTADFKPNENVSVNWECSPTLPHAIVTVTAGKLTRHLVVALGANDALYATDIDKAVSQGIEFAGWSVDGTALYGAGSASAGKLFNDVVIDFATNSTTTGEAKQASAKAQGDAQATVAFYEAIRDSDLTSVLKFKTSLSLSLLAKRAQPAFAPGELVWEVLPSNGVMRQVKFQGYLPELEHKKPRLALTDKPDRLEFKASQGKTKALWLTPNGESPTEGVLVSPQAEDSWIQPNEQSVVFTVNGVLFFRSITR